MSSWTSRSRRSLVSWRTPQAPPTLIAARPDRSSVATPVPLELSSPEAARVRDVQYDTTSPNPCDVFGPTVGPAIRKLRSIVEVVFCCQRASHGESHGLAWILRLFLNRNKGSSSSDHFDDTPQSRSHQTFEIEIRLSTNRLAVPGHVHCHRGGQGKVSPVRLNDLKCSPKTLCAASHGTFS